MIIVNQIILPPLRSEASDTVSTGRLNGKSITVEDSATSQSWRITRLVKSFLSWISTLLSSKKGNSEEHNPATGAEIDAFIATEMEKSSRAQKETRLTVVHTWADDEKPLAGIKITPRAVELPKAKVKAVAAPIQQVRIEDTLEEGKSLGDALAITETATSVARIDLAVRVDSPVPANVTADAPKPSKKAERKLPDPFKPIALGPNGEILGSNGEQLDANGQPLPIPSTPRRMLNQVGSLVTRLRHRSDSSSSSSSGSLHSPSLSSLFKKKAPDSVSTTRASSVSFLEERRTLFPSLNRGDARKNLFVPLSLSDDEEIIAQAKADREADLQMPIRDDKNPLVQLQVQAIIKAREAASLARRAAAAMRGQEYSMYGTIE